MLTEIIFSKMKNREDCTISRIGRTDADYIKALEDANRAQSCELKRLRKLVIKNGYVGRKDRKRVCPAVS